VAKHLLAIFDVLEFDLETYSIYPLFKSKFPLLNSCYILNY